jgi:DNA-binding transcriptional MerR regulator
MKIGDLAKRADLNASAIRYYEKAGLLSPPTGLVGNAATPLTHSTVSF